MAVTLGGRQGEGGRGRKPHLSDNVWGQRESEERHKVKKTSAHWDALI